MKLFKMFFRDEQQQSVDVLEAWEVRWTSRYGEFSGYTEKEARFFPNEDHAKEFKKALEDAFKLIKHTSGTQVSMSKCEL